jgi:hypothetical protein
VERDRIEEVDDLDPVALTFEPPAELPGRAVVTRAHRRGDDQDAPAHGQELYRLALREVGCYRTGPT